jgi:biotin carboxyl carrier protein
MRFGKLVAVLLAVAVVSGSGLLYWTRDAWLRWPPSPAADAPEPEHDHPHTERVRLSPQARANLQLRVRPVQTQTYWKTLPVPGSVIDRPGQSDRGVTAPVSAVVTRILAHPGDTVRAGEGLFTLRLISELVQNTQGELFKTTAELQLNREQLDRLNATAQGGAVSSARFIEVQNQERRLRTAAQGYRQELLNRGLTPAQVEAAAKGQFVSEITVHAPPADTATRSPLLLTSSESAGEEPAYEVQELKAHLGEQVQAGQTLCFLANHRALFLEGRAFKQEAPLLARAAEQGWPVRAEFAEEPADSWPAFEQPLQIRHLANTVDPVSRTFAFFVPLTNQSRTYQRGDETFLVWRFRPGQRVRLSVPVEELRDVFVLPAEAVVREGPEAYGFRQNGDVFERRPVHVVHEDRTQVVLANDGSLAAGQHVAQNAAAALNRVLKARDDGGHGHHHDHDH